MNERIAAVRQNELQQEYQILREKIIEELKEETDRKIKNQVREHFKNIQDEQRVLPTEYQKFYLQKFLFLPVGLLRQRNESFSFGSGVLARDVWK